MFDSLLNKRILSLAPKYRVDDLAPSSLKDLIQAPTLVVASGNSENTIYGDSSVNYAFRAWHDKLHIELCAPFTLEGERYVAMTQASILCRESEAYAEVIIAEVVKQAEYFEQHGMFPINQSEFINNELKKVGVL